MLEENAPQTGGFVLSLDFELMWGVDGSRTIAQRGAHVLGARQVIPRVLEIFARHDLGCTWATVGFLFCNDRDELMAALPARRPAYRNPVLSNYRRLDEVGADERRDPYHFAPSLIRLIGDCPRQEIGTHTLSHFYCLEEGQDSDAFAADLKGAIALAARRGYVLRSIVFPRNQVSDDALSVCRQEGLSAYRGIGRRVAGLGVPRSREGRLRRALRFADSYVEMGARTEPRVTRRKGMTDVPASLFLRPFSRGIAGAERLKVHRILAAMRRAARRGALFHLWFHPENFGVDQDENLAMLAQIASEAARLRDIHGWQTLNMAEAAGLAGAGRASSATPLARKTA